MSNLTTSRQTFSDDGTVFKPMRSFILFFALTMLPSSVLPAPELEVMHWWYRGGDNKAMHVLKNEFTRRGGIWYDVPHENAVETLNSAVSRITKGYSPTLVQWNSGWEVEQFHELGLLNSITETSQLHLIEQRMIDSVLDIVTVDGKLVAIPVTLHSENWAWYRPDSTLNKNSGVFNSWSNFLEYAKQVLNDGGTAMAVGAEPWQRRILFNNVLLGVAGKEFYTRFYQSLDASVVDEPKFAEVLRIFEQLDTFAVSFGEGRWEQQIAAVAADKAKTVFMGDWAKGEFRNIGLKLGRGYTCTPAPSTSGSLIPVMDVFVLGKVNNDQERQGQSLFLDVVTDPATSEAFNYLKGSLPPLSGIDELGLDPCNRISYRALKNKDSLLSPFAGHGDRAFLSSIEQTIFQLWELELSLSEQLQRFKDLVHFEQKRRGKANIIASGSER